MECKIGDKVWYARCDWVPKEILCPVCFGQKEVTVIFGNGDHVIVECDYCSKGYESASGVVSEYDYNNSPIQYTITEIRAEIKDCGTKYEFLSGHYILHDDKIFQTKEEAIERGKQLKKELEEDQATRLDHIKKSKHKSFSWNAGYHMREAKRCRREAERHERYARICTDRAKVKDTAQTA